MKQDIMNVNQALDNNNNNMSESDAKLNCELPMGTCEPKECSLRQSSDIVVNSIHEKCHMKNMCSRHETCPMILVHKIISGKWKLLILWYLTPGCLRFSEIKRKLPKVTQKMLTNQLRSLEEDTLIYRKVYPVIPPKVEYGLTDLGKKMYPILENMYSFGIDYLEVNGERSTDSIVDNE